MEGKFERSGARCGKTRRSRFAQSRGNRSEGLLVHSSAVSCSRKGASKVEETIAYSLGKQNRWLIPEVIREIKPSSAGPEDPEDVVLVERYTNVKCGRADCISVFNSKTAATRKPKRKLAQAKDLLGDSEDVKSRYEVAYPHPSGSRLKSTKRPAGHLGKRKKNSCTSQIFEDDLDDLGEIEYSDSEEDEDFSEQPIKLHQPRLDLDVLIKSPSKASPKTPSIEMSIPQCDPQSQLEGKHIFVESDAEMEQMHLEYLTQIKSRCSLLDARDEIIKNKKILKRKRRKCRHCGKTASHLSPLACGHNFCNSCWKAHLRTQIEQGRTDLQCPGYECHRKVDDVIVMSLLPSLYGRHLTKRLDEFLEMNPQLNWRPADQCKLVVKETTEEGTSAAHDVKCDISVQPVSVVFVCGTMWCFKCQEDAHWPATCEEARLFRQKNALYARKKKVLITSVGVKHCSSCNYPVEMGLGRNHMTCILCRNQYCWECLQRWWYPHKCKGHAGLRKIQLPEKFIHAVSYRHVAATSRVSRMSNVIHQKLDKIEEGLSLYAERFPSFHCREKRLDFLCRYKVISHLKEVFNFKFQARLVLKGLVISLSFSDDSARSKNLVMEFSRLLFIVERIDEMLKDLNHGLTKQDSSWFFILKGLINFGKECIDIIGRNTK